MEEGENEGKGLEELLTLNASGNDEVDDYAFSLMIRRKRKRGRKWDSGPKFSIQV